MPAALFSSDDIDLHICGGTRILSTGYLFMVVIYHDAIRGQGNIIFPCSADHDQDWQPYPIDPYSCYMCDHTYILKLLKFCGICKA